MFLDYKSHTTKKTRHPFYLDSPLMYENSIREEPQTQNRDETPGKVRRLYAEIN